MRFRGASRERCYTLFSTLGFRTLVTEFAPTAESVVKDYAVVETLDGVRAIADEIAAAGRVALHVVADGDAGMRAAIGGLVVSTAARTRPLPAVR